MICRILKGLKRNEKGVAALEFAISLPLIFLLMFSVIEVTRFILVAQMVTNVSRTVADLTAQGGVTSKADLDNLLDAVEFVAQPFDMQADGRVIVSAINQAITPGANPNINWQECQGDQIGDASQIGIPGNVPTVPNGIIRPGFTVIAAEAYYNFEPLLFAWIMPPTKIYRANYFRTRLGGLTALPGAVGC
ncbi:MAG: pilus assembly protein [Alphaproteobacteria bacterium]|nr:pilus assembly protein [Alphaproteobacteria bacterium]